MRRRQLDRQGQAVELPADALEICPLSLSCSKARLGSRRALDEQCGCFRGLERRKPQHEFAADVQRLAAGRQHRQSRAGPQQSLDEHGATDDDVLAVVQDEQHRLRNEGADDRPSIGSPPSSTRPRASAIALGINAWSAIGARSTNTTASPADARAASIARRVLPAPPGPVSVTKRDPISSRRRPATSASRPTKLVRWTGSPCGMWDAPQPCGKTWGPNIAALNSTRDDSEDGQRSRI